MRTMVLVPALQIPWTSASAGKIVKLDGYAEGRDGEQLTVPDCCTPGRRPVFGKLKLEQDIAA